MVQPRRSLIKLHDTPYYHVAVQCARRASLSGVDAHTGKDYSHRAAWLLERMARLSAVFCIDVCAYAIMRNYYEAVLHIDRAHGAQLPAAEVIRRWSALYQPPKVITLWQQGALDDEQRAAAERLIEQWRAQLCDLSWFMRCLNEHVARRANAEDGCTGCFWETRFKCRALVNEVSLLAAMAHVDLSPLRAPGAAPEVPRSTSIQARIEQSFRGPDAPGQLQLLSFDTPLPRPQLAVIPFAFRDYLELLDWTGRRARGDALAATSAVPHLLQHLGIDAADWLIAMRPSNAERGARPLARLQRHSERWMQRARFANGSRARA